MRIIKENKTKTGKFEKLTRVDLSNLKGGGGKWVYDVVKKEWYWLEY